MSRGPGRIQSAILDAIDASGSLSFGQLCWQLAEEDGRGISEAGDLAQTFYASCHRAVNRLADGGNLSRTRRKLQSIAELVTHYPYKTRQKTVRDMRIRLLPCLSGYLHETKMRQFGLAEIERFFLSQQNEDVMRKFGKRWKDLEDPLSNLLGEVPSERREIVLDLLVKGREMFLASDGAKHPSDLGSLIKRALSRSGHLEAENSLYVEINELYVSFFPVEKQRLMNFKDRLYAVTDLSKRGNTKPYLKGEFKQELLKRDAKYLESLPGHQPETETRHDYGVILPHPVQYSPVLDQLIGRDSLAAFDFLSRTSRRGSSTSRS